MMLLKKAAVTAVLLIFFFGCGGMQIDPSGFHSLKKVAVVSVFSPGKITTNNPGQMIGFGVADVVASSKMDKDALRPLVEMLLKKGEEDVIAQFSKAFGWQVQPLQAVMKSPHYGELSAWSNQHREDRFKGMINANNAAFLWIDGPKDELVNTLKQFCSKTGSDAVIIYSFDFAFTKGWYGSSGIGAKPRTFSGIQIVDKNGKIIASIERADRRERDYSDVSDVVMPLQGWTTKIDKDTIGNWDQSISRSVALIVTLINDAVR